MIDPTIADLRRDYRMASLDEGTAGADPHALFRRWFDEAVAADVAEPNGMTIASVDADGRPSARIVLLKGADERGFVFFTNYESRKGRELAQSPHGALVFWWSELERQIRIEGLVGRVDASESDLYFASRPLASRIGAWASPQSAVIPSRATIEAREVAVRERFGDAPPRPTNWGGFRLVPQTIEFWQGRASRLHDRLRFTRIDLGWNVERLAP